MKIISIYIDIRESSSFVLEKKKKVYEKMYTQFSSYERDWENMSHRNTRFIGDGVLIVLNANILNNEGEIIELLKEINRKVISLENKYNIRIGCGLSYGEAVEGGDEDLLISNSIDAASFASKITNKIYGSYKTWRWALPLTRGDDNKGSIEDMQDLLENQLPDDQYKKSGSKKNLWFNFNG